MSSYISSTDLALKAESDFIKFEIAGTFTLLACLISVYNVWCHLRHFGQSQHAPSLPHIVTQSLIYSHSPSLTHSRSHAVTHSLSHSLICTLSLPHPCS
jgi:hypothetical protein